MIYGVYAVRDRLAGFAAPYLEQNDPMAMRGFERIILDRQSMPNFKPSDFDLCKLGTFDTDSGVISPSVPVLEVVSGQSLYLSSIGPAKEVS